jgi:plastocyanin
MRRKLATMVAIAAFIGAIAAPSPAATKSVSIRSNAFQPAQLKVFVGDTVRWVNEDGRRHSVSANSSARAQGEAFDSGSNCPGGLLFDDCMRQGQSFSHTFTTVGTFTYRCRIHGSDTSFAACDMCGQIIVRVRPAPPPTQQTTGTPTGSLSPTSTTSTSTSPSTSPSVGASTTLAGAGNDGDDASFPVLPIAAAAVALLTASAMVVYRTMLKR